MRGYQTVTEVITELLYFIIGENGIFLEGGGCLLLIIILRGTPAKMLRISGIGWKKRKGWENTIGMCFLSFLEKARYGLL